MMKILVVAHDAGGANILGSLMIKYQHKFDWAACVAGPAKDIFLQKKIKSLKTGKQLESDDIEAVLTSQRPDLVLTGTSWGSRLEAGFIKQARLNRVKSASFLDHWGAYRERFDCSRAWKKSLPDLILVGDSWAYDLALKNGFPQGRLFQVKNPYFEEIIGKRNSFKAGNPKFLRKEQIDLLYLSQPIYSHGLKAYNDPHHWGFTEYDVVNDLLKAIDLLKDVIKIKLKIRLHPSEKPNKYMSLLKNSCGRGIRKVCSVSKPDMTIDSLVKDCSAASIVIGAETMALFIALVLGNKTICYMPNQKKLCTLPQKEITKVYAYHSLIREIKKFKHDQARLSGGFDRALSGTPFLSIVKKLMCSDQKSGNVDARYL